MSVYSACIGHNGGYGSAGLGLGPRYGNGGMKGPNKGRNIFMSIKIKIIMRLCLSYINNNNSNISLNLLTISGYGAAAGVTNGQGVKNNGMELINVIQYNMSYSH